MSWFGAAAAAVLVMVLLVDAFEVMILPRRVRHSYRLARLFYPSAWVLWRAVARLLPAGRWRNGFLSVFGPLSLFALLAVWAAGLITGFALAALVARHALLVRGTPDDGFAAYLYFSGTTFFTLGYGDLVPTGHVGPGAERGRGRASASASWPSSSATCRCSTRRSRGARSPSRCSTPAPARRPAPANCSGAWPTAAALAGPGPLLVEWERWAAELLESHLSFPVLSYYRSQHDNQSWVGALTDHPRHLRAAHRRRGRPGRPPGAADVRDGPPRGGGPGAGVPDAAPAAGTGPAAAGRPRPAVRVAARGGAGAARRAGGGEGAGGAARPVRAVRQRSGRVLPVRVAAVSSRRSRRWTTGRPAPGGGARRAWRTYRPRTRTTSTWTETRKPRQSRGFRPLRIDRALARVRAAAASWALPPRLAGARHLKGLGRRLRHVRDPASPRLPHVLPLDRLNANQTPPTLVVGPDRPLRADGGELGRELVTRRKGHLEFVRDLDPAPGLLHRPGRERQLVGKRTAEFMLGQARLHKPPQARQDGLPALLVVGRERLLGVELNQGTGRRRKVRHVGLQHPAGIRPARRPRQHCRGTAPSPAVANGSELSK